MLINTLILWLKDLTPVFIAAALLLSLASANLKQTSLNKIKTSEFIASLLFGILLAFVLVAFMPSLSVLYNGTGAELLTSGFYLLVYLLFIAYIHSAKKGALYLILTLLFAIKLMSFISYFSLYNASSSTMTVSLFNVKLYGLFLGVGISVSFATLLFFMVEKIKALFSVNVIVYLALIFFVGQLSGITSLLIQVDLISDSQPLWDSSELMRDNSEYGVLLNSLFGYEATPSLSFLGVYISTLIMPLVFFYYSNNTLLLGRYSHE
jgi:high-affinity iron transporter